MPITIREYQPTDQPTLIKLYEDFQDYLVAMDPIKRIRRLPSYGKHTLQTTLLDVQNKNGVFYIALDRDQIIGFIVAVVLKQEEAELYECIPSTIGRVTDLFIIADFRKQGIGKMLMKKAEQHCKKNGCDVVYIEIFEPNTHAHNFYQSLGYTDRLRDVIKQL